MLEPRIVAISVSRFVEAVGPADVRRAEAVNHATLRPGLGTESPSPFAERQALGSLLAGSSEVRWTAVW